MTSRFVTISDLIYECNWHLYPPELRRFIQFMMVSAQKPIHLRGICNIHSDQENFKKVDLFQIRLKNDINMIFHLDSQCELFVLYAAASGQSLIMFCSHCNRFPHFAGTDVIKCMDCTMSWIIAISNQHTVSKYVITASTMHKHIFKWKIVNLLNTVLEVVLFLEIQITNLLTKLKIIVL